MVAQGTAISSEFLSQPPPGIVAVLRGLLPPKKCLKLLDWPSPAGSPLQGTGLVIQSTAEANLERLVPLVNFFGSVEASTKCISMGPAYSRKRVQDSVLFASAYVQRGIYHSGGLRAGSGNGTRSRYSLEEGGHRGGPSLRQRVSVLQPLLHHSEEGLRPILDLILVNRSVMKLKFKMLTIKQVVPQIRSEDWFVTIHLKDAYFHISIFHDVPEVRFQGQSVPISDSSVQPSTLTPVTYVGRNSTVPSPSSSAKARDFFRSQNKGMGRERF